MSQNSKKKSAAKRKHSVAAQNKRENERVKAFARNEDLLVNLPKSYFEELLAPSKDCVIFKGLTQNIADKLLVAFREDSENSGFTEDFVKFDSLPLSNFYAEIPLNNHQTVKIHWMPYTSPISKKEFHAYMKRKQTYDLKSRERIPTVDRVDFIEDEIYATIVIEYRGLYFYSHFFYSPRLRRMNAAGIYSNYMIDVFHNNRQAFDDYMANCRTFEYYILVIQHLVRIYLEGEEIPKIASKIIDGRHDDGNTDNRHRETTPAKPSKDPTECIAYIHLDAGNGKLTISDSSRAYSMKWWIVSGHLRHYANGKVIEIPPYIKGDKDDPDAQKALAEFVEGFKRVKYYHLIARTPK